MRQHRGRVHARSDGGSVMSSRIHLAAIIVREGRLLLHRESESVSWELPGGPLLPEHEDVDAAMDAILETMGIHAPAVEEDFVETIHLAREGGVLVYNIYAPTEWTGEPTARGLLAGWFELQELAVLPMEERVRSAVLAAFGLGERRDDAAEVLAALGQAVPGAGGPDALLDARCRSIVAVGVVAALGRPAALQRQIAAALDMGASPGQLAEALGVVSTYAGQAAAEEAWPVMEAVFAERGVAAPGATP